MSTKTVQVLAAVLAAVLLVSVALFVLVSAAPARGSNTPAWCGYPEPASVAALPVNTSIAAQPL
jgi:Co/Zn/Cd efflux system component